ncbi:MAG: ATP-binding protein [Opitutus sp.]|nr:ATP-binding protein [Opitutus sp.]
MTLLVSLLGLALVLMVAAWWRERARRHRAQDAYRGDVVRLQAAHEATLRDHARQNQAVLDSMIEGIVVLDRQNHVRMTNRAAATMFGFSLPADGRALLETVRHHEVVALVARLAEEPVVLNHELRIEGVKRLLVQVNAVGLRDSGGVPSGAVLVFHDLTRMRELEGVRQDFVANVSHELRTPLSLIKSATETLIDGAKNDPESLDKLLNIVDRHATRLTRLIDDLLLLAKLDSGRLALRLQRVTLSPLVQEVADDLAQRAAARQIVVKNELSEGISAQADPDRLRQVLSNLIDNAIKYGRAGGSIFVGASVLNERLLEVFVRDDGPGLTPEAKTRIFERFYRVDKARSREQGGTGLGLAIVKHVVQAHGGEVRVESTPGHGATFYFTLPRP